MNLAELSALLDASTDVLRVETLECYSSASDGDMVARYLRGDPKPDPSEKQVWLDRLAAAAAAGHPWRRLRVVPHPVPDYVRYACEWGYVDNVAAGEDVRVVDPTDDRWDARELRTINDLYVIPGNGNVVMYYDGLGAFTGASHARGPIENDIAREIEFIWRRATPFTKWWNANPDLHRDLAHR